VDAINLDTNVLVTESVKTEYRDKDAIAEFLNRPRPFSRITAIKCFCGNWDSERIGSKNIVEITRAIFRNDRKKCPQFSKYDKYASPLAVKERDDLKLEKIDKKIALAVSILSLFISIFLPLISG
jgi:hypothetical protein